MDKVTRSLGKFAVWPLRVSLGLVLVAIGINHYRNIPDYQSFLVGPMPDNLPYLAEALKLIGWLFPAILIVGGILYLTKQMQVVAHFLILLAISAVFAWVALAITLGNLQVSFEGMQFTLNAMIISIMYYLVAHFEANRPKK